jgi:opacity protein-like surface antigen
MGLNKNYICIVVTVLTLTCISFKAYSSTESEEISLPDSVRRSIASQSVDDTSAFDECRIHGGVSLINSFQDYSIAAGIRERGGIRGFDLNLGIDLFSPHWIAEGEIIALPESQINDTRLSSNGFELRMLYDTNIIESVTVHGGVGIASRSYHIKTLARADLSGVQAGERSFASGATVLVGGADYWPSQEISIGIEVSNHIPMANGDDPTSIDMGIKLNGHF